MWIKTQMLLLWDSNWTGSFWSHFGESNIRWQSVADKWCACYDPCVWQNIWICWFMIKKKKRNRICNKIKSRCPIKKKRTLFVICLAFPEGIHITCCLTCQSFFLCRNDRFKTILVETWKQSCSILCNIAKACSACQHWRVCAGMTELLPHHILVQYLSNGLS